jgi:hypothetical protein
MFASTTNQTLTFLASEQDPGTTGYLVAIASDPDFGCPTSFNFLIGDEYVKTDSGHQPIWEPRPFAALYTSSTAPGCDGNSITANINFNGVEYNRAPRVFGGFQHPSILDGNNTRTHCQPHWRKSRNDGLHDRCDLRTPV